MNKARKEATRKAKLAPVRAVPLAAPQPAATRPPSYRSGGLGGRKHFVLAALMLGAIGGRF